MTTGEGADRRVREVAEAFQAAVDAGELELPLPGGGRTYDRWQALADVAADDLCVARLAEAHLDALAILGELGAAAPAGSRWGVWASRSPAAPVTAKEQAGGWVLTGTKSWCSGARACTHALVTADAPDGYRLFAVELAQATPLPGTWAAVGMAGSDSLDVDLTGARAQPVGGPGRYLDRPGFWHGAIAVSACWYGGAVGVGRALLQAAERKPLGPYALAHLGAVDTALSAAGTGLRAAATAVDEDPTAGQELLAFRLRAQIEAAATEVLDRVGRALGARPLGQDRRHAALAADLPVYLRQSHAEPDHAHLGELVLERGVRW